MGALDGARFIATALSSHRLRSGLTGLGIAVGIATVVLLTALGRGLEGYILAEFTQFGTNLIGVTPGRTETFGHSPAILGTVRPLSVDDAEALARLPQVLVSVPVLQGNAAVEVQGRSRRVTVLGVGPDAPQAWQFAVGAGQFLPREDARTARPLVVLGATVRRELFGAASPLGAVVRIGGFRYRVVGVMQAKGQILGFDLDDAVYVPVARAQELFNREGLMEIDILYAPGAEAAVVADRVRDLLVDRHDREDFTITTQDQMLDVLGSILDKLTLVVAGLGAVSLVVGGVGILTIMTIAVADRVAEIGLLRALGATSGQILGLFLAEAVVLSLAGGLAGLLLGLLAAGLVRLLVPALPVQPDPFYTLLAVAIALSVGLAAGVLPARRAAGLDPVAALRGE
ncbi:MAG: ABC transporter permease [Thermodesulfobacteriota bacterium]